MTVFRTAGAWGAGKGSDLTAAEVDTNFYELLTRAAALEANPAQPVSIHSVNLSGTEFTVTLTDSSVQGPFTIPVNVFNWVGEWTPSTAYDALDTFYVEDDGVYYVVNGHVSGTEFDAYLSGSESEIYYIKLVSDTTLYDMSYYLPGVVGEGLGDDTPLMQFVSTRNIYLPAHTEALPVGQAYLRVANTLSLTLEIQKNGVAVGEINFAAGVQTGVFTVAASVLYEPGDVLSIVLVHTFDTETAQRTDVDTYTETYTESETGTDTVLTTELTTSPVTEWVTEIPETPDAQDLSVSLKTLRGAA